MGEGSVKEGRKDGWRAREGARKGRVGNVGWEGELKGEEQCKGSERLWQFGDRMSPTHIVQSMRDVPVAARTFCLRPGDFKANGAR